MSRILQRLALVFVPLALLLMTSLPAARAATAPTLATPTGLALAEIKITGNEFVMLINNTGSDISDLSGYWLEDYNNVNPVSSGVSNSSQQLPVGSLGAGQTVLLSSGGDTCGAAVTGKLSISLNDSGGFLEVVQNSLTNGEIVQSAGDAVSWSSGSNSATGMIANVPSNSSDPNGAWYRYQNSSTPSYAWQQADVDSNNNCQLNAIISKGLTAAGPVDPGNQLLPGTPPPVGEVNVASASSSGSGPSLPAGDVGLMAPEINELLPNPASPATDANDEFIELYNPNSKSFDLSGFELQTSSSTSSTIHSYTFPEGTSLPGQSFTAFYSSQTNLEMNNGGGQVVLLDPLGNIISQSAPYGTAKDGQSWALANGQWYWTSSPTPNAANSVSGSSSSSSKKSNSSKSEATRKTSSSASGATGTTNDTADDADLQPTPIHPAVLALVAGLALLYGAYEYRHDLANRYHQFERYRAARRGARAKS